MTTDPRVDAVLDHEWPLIEQHDRHDAHRNHNYTAWCAVCRGDIPAILKVADAAVRTDLTHDGVRRDKAIRPRGEQCPNCGERNWRDDMGIRDCQTCGYQP